MFTQNSFLDILKEKVNLKTKNTLHFSNYMEQSYSSYGNKFETLHLRRVYVAPKIFSIFYLLNV